jgi:hypothetical protein
MAAETRHCHRGLVEIGLDHVAPIFSVELGREARRADEIAEHHRDRTPLGGGARSRRRRGRRSARGLSGRGLRIVPGEAGDGAHEPLAMPERHANLLEIRLDQVGQDVSVDLMLAEQRFVLSEVDRVQPLGDVHRRSRTRFDSHDGPRDTASPGRERCRPLCGRFDLFATPGNGRYLREADGWSRRITFSNGSRGEALPVIDALGCLRSLRARWRLMG